MGPAGLTWARSKVRATRIYYDYLRPHSALNGETPAKAAGIDLQLNGNKWAALIKKAAKKSNGYFS